MSEILIPGSAGDIEVRLEPLNAADSSAEGQPIPLAIINGVGETDDLYAVLAWAKTRFPDSPLWLAGFSFGAWIALKSTQQLQPERLVLVAPPVDMYDFSVIPEVSVPWMVIQGGGDEVVSAAAVAGWVAQRQPAPQLKMLDSAGHFFHGQLKGLKSCLIEGFLAG